MASVRELIDSKTIGRLQVQILVVCFAINMVEGYDLLSMALAVVPLSDAWALSGTETGLLLSIGPIGMALGAALLTPLGDRYGRRPFLLLGLVIIAVFIGLSGTADGYTELAVYRLGAGVGMGAVPAFLVIILSEFAPTGKRAAAIGLNSIGIALGGSIGGGVGGALMAAYGWRSAFWLGAVATAICFVAAYFGIPETPDFLAAKNTKTTQGQLAKVLTKMGIDPSVADFRETATIDAPTQAVPVKAVFAVRSGGTVVLALAFALTLTLYYFGSMWLPQLLVLAGMSTAEGINGVVLLTLGGATSGVLVAFISGRVSPFVLTLLFLVPSTVLMAIFGAVSGNLTLALIIAPMLGLVQQGATLGVYALVPQLYEPRKRATVMGVCTSTGRVGMIAMPLGVGALIDVGWMPEDLFYVMSAIAVLVIVLVVYLQRSSMPRKQKHDAAHQFDEANSTWASLGQ